MTTTHDGIHATNWRKVAGVALLLIPIGMLLLLGIGEMAGGDISGLQHIVELAPLISLAILAWKRPRIGGTILVALATLLATLYPMVMGGRFPIWALLINDVMLFGPAMASGVLLITTCQGTSPVSPTVGPAGHGLPGSG